MLKALAWKEYREQRQIALVGLLVSGSLPMLFIAVGLGVAGPSLSFEPRDLIRLSAFTVVMLVWPVFAAVAGAATNLREARVGALCYLLSRPVTREQVWAVKVGLGVATLGTIIGGSLAIFWAIQRMFLGPGSGSGLATLGDSDVGWLVGFLGLTFACAVLFTALTSSALVAAGAGLASSLALHAFVIGFGAVAGLRQSFDRFSKIEIFVVILLALAGSVHAIKRGELLRDRRVGRVVLFQTIVALALILFISSGITFALTRVSISNAVFTDPTLSPMGDAVAVRANRANLSAEQIWLLDFEGNAMPLAARGSRLPAFSPDGGWVAYTSRAMTFAYPPVRLDLRIVRPDGTEARSMGPSAGSHPVFSPDGQRVATVSWRELTVAHLESDEMEIITLPDNSRALRTAWTPDGEEVLLTLNSMRSRETLAFLHLESGRVRAFEPPEEWLSEYSYSLPLKRPIPSRIPITGHWPVRAEPGAGTRRARREYGIGIVNREDLDSEILVRGICRFVSLDLSIDERYLIYSACDDTDIPETERHRARATLHLRDLENGDDRILTTFGEHIRSVRFNLAGTHVLASIGGYLGMPRGAAVVSLSGDVISFDPLLSPVGWIDDRRALLARYPDPSDPGEARPGSYWPETEVLGLVIYDVDTHEQRTVFSR